MSDAEEMPYPTHIRVTGYQWEPNLWVKISGSKMKLWGPMNILLEYISRSLNVSYALVPPTEDQSGVKVPNKDDWTGMMGMLYREEADLSIVPLLMSEERSAVAKFTNPVFIGNIKILVGRPPKVAILSSLLGAFDEMVWLWFVILFLTVLIVASLTWRIVEKFPKDFYGPESEQTWNMIALLLNKDAYPVPKSGTGKLLLMLWCVVAIIFGNMYGGQLISILTVAKAPDFVKEIADVPRFPKVQPVLHRGSNEVEYFRSSKKPPQSEVWRRVVRNNASLMTHDELYGDPNLDKVEKGQNAIFQEWRLFQLHLAERLHRKGNCSFFITPAYRIIPVGIGMTNRINRKFVCDVNQRIEYFLQGNLLDYYYPQKQSTYQLCVEDRGQQEMRSMGVNNFISSFQLLMAGMAVSTFVFFLEALVHRIKRNSSVRTSYINQFVFNAHEDS